jgi:phospholipid/cholesterol/gamma-HCH transport system substrate-binding protein
VVSEVERRRRDEGDDDGSRVRRYATLAALLGVAAITAYLLLGSGDEYEVTAEFENASQLVGGEEVVVGGTTAGSVKSIELGDNGQALVTFTVSEEYAPLRRGTVATMRAGSLSSIAGRKLELTLPPDSDSGDAIPDGGEMGQSETVSEVDLDEVFNTLDPKTIKDFKHVIQGLEISYDGIGKQANKGLHYLNPFLSTSRRLFGELTADEPALENLVVDTSQLSGALAARAPDISALVGNLNLMMNAIGDRKQRLAQAVSLFPDFMREANTTFVNLRAALDDVDPLVEAAKPAAKRLGPFFAELRGAAADAVPTLRDTQRIIKRKGKDNDLVELTRLQPRLASSAVGSGAPDCGSDPNDSSELGGVADDDFSQGAFGESACALSNSIPQLSALRAYSPDIAAWFDGYSHPAYIDALGGQARIAATFNAFNPSVNGLPIINILDLPNLIDTVLDETAFENSIVTGAIARCPGANERPVNDLDPGDDSVPFTEGGALTDGSPPDCDPSITVPGP